MFLLKTLATSLLVGTALAASTLANLAPDHEAAMKSDLPILTTAMLPLGMDSSPYPPSYEAEISLVSDSENCDETEVLDTVVQIAD